MANIIMRKGVEPHYNRALGKVIRNEREYKETMKKMGCEPYNPEKAERAREARTTKYKPSDEARAVAKAGAAQMERDGRVSGSVMKWLVKNSNTKPCPKELLNKKTGGMYQD